MYVLVLSNGQLARYGLGPAQTCHLEGGVTGTHDKRTKKQTHVVWPCVFEDKNARKTKLYQNARLLQGIGGMPYLG